MVAVQQVAGSITQNLVFPCPTRKCKAPLIIESGDNPLRLIYEHFQGHRGSSEEREQLEQEYADLASAHRDLQMEFNALKSAGPRSGMGKETQMAGNKLVSTVKNPTQAEETLPSASGVPSSGGRPRPTEESDLPRTTSPEKVPEIDQPQYCDMCLKTVEKAKSSATEPLSLKEPEVPETTSIDQTLGIEKLQYCNVCLKSIDKMSENAKEKHIAGCGTTVDASLSLTAQEAKQERQTRKSHESGEEGRETVATRSSPGASKGGQKRKGEGKRESTPPKRAKRNSK